MTKTKTKQVKSKRESGAPGGGAGRKDEIGKSGVYRVSGPQPAGDAPIVGMASWGQGKRGAAGYEDHGDSEIYLRAATPEKCRDIMTKDPVCCVVGDSVTHAAQIMKERDIGALPVVDDQEHKKVVGLVSDRDLIVKAVAAGLDPKATALGRLMSKPVFTCSPDDDYNRALGLMEKYKVKRIPVVDNSGRAVGVISQADVAIRLRDHAKTAELVETISQPNPV